MSINRVASGADAMQQSNQINRNDRMLGGSLRNLSSGKTINGPSDDPAGFSQATLLSIRGGGLSQSINNVSNAKGMLGIAESGYEAVTDLLMRAREKAVQAADASYSDDQRGALQGEVEALLAEVDDIVSETTYQDIALIDGSFSAQRTQTGAEAGETLEISLGGASTAALGVDDVSVATQDDAAAALADIDAALTQVLQQAQNVGEYRQRLDSRTELLEAEIANTQAARSRIEDTDFAEEQLALIKSQILLESSQAAAAQSNASAQQVLKLF